MRNEKRCPTFIVSSLFRALSPDKTNRPEDPYLQADLLLPSILRAVKNFERIQGNDPQPFAWNASALLELHPQYYSGLALGDILAGLFPAVVIHCSDFTFPAKNTRRCKSISIVDVVAASPN